MGLLDWLLGRDPDFPSDIKPEDVRAVTVNEHGKVSIYGKKKIGYEVPENEPASDD